MLAQNYAHDLQRGEEYQDFVADELRKRGIVFTSYVSRKWQLKGENTLGLEIKFDAIMQSSDRIFIETSCYSVTLGKWVASGCCKQDNSWLYAIGNYVMLFIFGKKHLKKFAHEIRDGIKRPGISEPLTINNGRARGYCISKEAAERACVWKITFDGESKW